MRIRFVAGMLLAVLVAACAGGPSAPPDTPFARASAAAPSGELTVFAAASLTDAFEAAAERYGQAHPDVSVAFNFASSSTLATQIVEGAPTDVFASANQTQMDVVEDAGLIADERTDFAGNSLQIAVEPGNPMGIESLQDLARHDATVVLAAEEVPAGAYAREALDAQGIGVDPVHVIPGAQQVDEVAAKPAADIHDAVARRDSAAQQLIEHIDVDCPEIRETVLGAHV